MALLLTAAVVVLTVYTGGLFWLILIIPILLITAVQNPAGAAYGIVYILTAIGLFYLIYKGYILYNKKVTIPRQQNTFEEYKKEQIAYLEDLIKNGFFRGTEKDKQEIIDHINQTDIFHPYPITWQKIYYNPIYFITPDMLNDSNINCETYREEVEKNKLKNIL